MTSCKYFDLEQVNQFQASGKDKKDKRSTIIFLLALVIAVTGILFGANQSFRIFTNILTLLRQEYP
ncbi:MAG: hypothetical protein OXU45_06520, partial [Candidatus Melainabacteria bacterium]|nr:hypothetical protein [Candidatus Melainabacteria bacterium]